ncbi:MAG: helix-turn-helix transcriptional regulator [Thermodesulfovibrionia bacterium]|nr:helix-turn-helix transcriptional regulator [Thermodesulfovibrionia bacterium]
MITFGENILLWRLYKSLSQEQLAALSGIPRPNLSDIEKGKRDVTLSTIRLLAHALGVSPGTLVNGEPPKRKNREEYVSRESMERIASSVAQGKPPKDLTERHVYSLLKEVLHCSLLCARTRQRRLPLPTRRGNRAWLILRAQYSKETINSLIVRSLEHTERKWTGDK